jgi:hypothetical protein
MELRRMAAEHIEQNDNLLEHLFNYVTTETAFDYYLSIKIDDVIQSDVSNVSKIKEYYNSKYDEKYLKDFTISEKDKQKLN